MTTVKLLYGFPLPVDKLQDLCELERHVETLTVMVDCPDQVDALDAFLSVDGRRSSAKPWQAFIKVDQGNESVSDDLLPFMQADELAKQAGGNQASRRGGRPELGRRAGLEKPESNFARILQPLRQRMYALLHLMARTRD